MMSWLENRVKNAHLVPRANSASVADRRETTGRTREEGEKGKVPMGRTREEGEKWKDVVAPIRVPFSRRERERDGVVERMTDLVQHTAAATVCAENSCINRLEQRRARLVVHTVCIYLPAPSAGPLPKTWSPAATIKETVCKSLQLW